jgi:hypothetical protein
MLRIRRAVNDAVEVHVPGEPDSKAYSSQVVLDFVNACEALLSPLLLNRDLPPHESELIRGYISLLSDSCRPWDRSHPNNPS